MASQLSQDSPNIAVSKEPLGVTDPLHRKSAHYGHCPFKNIFGVLGAKHMDMKLHMYDAYKARAMGVCAGVFPEELGVFNPAIPQLVLLFFSRIQPTSVSSGV